MKDMMGYKGYFGSVHYNDEDRVFHGKIELK
jgi:predicted HicB family RNase H-like nuclease